MYLLVSKLRFLKFYLLLSTYYILTTVRYHKLFDVEAQVEFNQKQYVHPGYQNELFPLPKMYTLASKRV